MNLLHLSMSAYHPQDTALHIQAGCLLLKHLRYIQSMALFSVLLPLFRSLSVNISVKSGYINTVMEHIIRCMNKPHIFFVLSSCVLENLWKHSSQFFLSCSFHVIICYRFFFPLFLPLWEFVTWGKRI